MVQEKALGSGLFHRTSSVALKNRTLPKLPTIRGQLYAEVVPENLKRGLKPLTNVGHGHTAAVVSGGKVG